MTNTAMTKVGAGATVRYATAPQNSKGLTYRGWLAQAHAKNTTASYTSWKAGESPASAMERAAAPNPMSSDTKLALMAGGAVVVLAAVVGGVYLYQKKAKSTKSWKLVQSGIIPGGAKARISVPVASVQAAIPTVSNAAGLTSVLSMVRELTNVTVWGPKGVDASLPKDWPSNDPAADKEFHVELTNAFATSITPGAGLAGLPAMPMLVWVWS